MGWAGVYERGSRADAGFTLIQADRVITGWPSSFRPTTLFGDQEGGTNDLVNQRLVGEIYLDGFEISHTKDEILFSDKELTELEAMLFEKLGDYKELALSYRKYASDQRNNDDAVYDIVLNEFENEINSRQLHDFIATYEAVPTEQLVKVNKTIQTNVTKRLAPSLKAEINKLTIYLYMVNDLSPNDPYIVNDATTTEETVIIIINMAHPHWEQLTHKESILNFIRHCVYDGVAEWKCYFRTGEINSDTIKKLKDNLLRIPFEIEQHQTV